VDVERKRPGRWLGLVLNVLFSTLITMMGRKNTGLSKPVPPIPKGPLSTTGTGEGTG